MNDFIEHKTYTENEVNEILKNRKFISFFKKEFKQGYETQLWEHIVREFFQECIFLRDFRADEPNQKEIVTAIVTRYSKRCEEKSFSFQKEGIELTGTLKTFFEKSYSIVTPSSPKARLCLYCEKVLPVEAISGLQKYCNHRCRLMAQYQRVNEKKGSCKNIEIHKTCQFCGKPLTKRAGASTCSVACRVALHRQKKKA